jgi:hypothetical protein
MTEAKTETKFATYIKTAKLDARRLLVASHGLETLQRDDRALRHAKRTNKKAEGDAKGPAETRKPRSGRPVTPRALEAAMTGKSVSGPTKQRILRAVNHILTQKKQDKVELKALF